MVPIQKALQILNLRSQALMTSQRAVQKLWMTASAAKHFDFLWRKQIHFAQ
jgi:hypothetical protein